MAAFDDQLAAALPALWRFAWSLTRDAALADDLVQDCAERALRKRLLFLPGRAMLPWLIKMLLNIHRNRWSASSGQTVVGLDQAETLVCPAASPEERLDMQRLLQRVSDLPAEQREPLLVVAIAGLSYADAAQALGIPVGTLMSRLSRARARLRRDAETMPPVLRSVK